MKAFAYALIILLLSGVCANAQTPQVIAIAKLDTTTIRIGDQAHLNLTVIAPPNFKVFPISIPDTFHKIEVVSRGKIDTTKSTDGKTFTYKQSVTLTGFDSGYYVIEPLTVYFMKSGGIDRDSAITEAMLLQVQTVPVDTTKEIKDIKPPVEVPFTFRDAIPYIIGVLALIAAIIFISRWLKKRKLKPKEEKVIVIPQRPAHEIALEALEKIKEEKLWQAGHYKEYHSAVADTVRQYVEHRFAIPALEMPSDETLGHFRNGTLLPGTEAFEKLTYILHLADMVKFAKGIPIGSENERAMQHAIDFVMLTKPVTKEDNHSTNSQSSAVTTNEKKEVHP